jgi:hypothetical protein
MLILIILAALSAYAIGASIVSLRNDGLHRMPTDWSRRPDRTR